MNTASLIESVTDRFPDAVSASHTYRGDATVVLLNLGDVPATVRGITGTILIATNRSRNGEAITGTLVLEPRTGLVIQAA